MISFTGMAGCGKTHWGSRIVRQFGMPLVEMDADVRAMTLEGDSKVMELRDIC